MDVRGGLRDTGRRRRHSRSRRDADRGLQDHSRFGDHNRQASYREGYPGDHRQKVEIYSLPWKSIDMWSSENAGKIDFNAEMEFWTRAGHVKLNLKKGVDVRRFDRIVAAYVL